MKIKPVKPYQEMLDAALARANHVTRHRNHEQELRELQALHRKENLWLLVMMTACVSATALLTIFCPVL
jgi:cell division protein FtsX